MKVDISPPLSSETWGIDEGLEHPLLMLGRLTQLKVLRLHSWEYRGMDLHFIAQLSSLVNLEVNPTSFVVKKKNYIFPCG